MDEHETGVNLLFVIQQSVFTLSAQAGEFLTCVNDIVACKPPFKASIKWFDVFYWNFFKVINIALWVV